MKKIIYLLVLGLASLLTVSCFGNGDPEQKLKTIVKYDNQKMPMQVDAAVLIKDIVVEDSFVVYNAEVDEQILSIEDIDASGLKSSIMANYQGEVLEGMREFLDCCKDTGRGIAYRYKGNSSGKKVEVVLNVDDLP